MSPRISPASFLKHATDVATFYGFRPMRDIERRLASTLRAPRGGLYSFNSAASVAALAHMQRKEEPVLGLYATPSPMYLPKGLSSRDVGELGLMVIGSNESLGEIVLLKTLVAIITEWGIPISRVRLNAMGDKDSRERFRRELGGYLRKHMQNVDPYCQKHVTENPFLSYSCQNGACREMLGEGPRSMSFLSEKSRLHFKSMLEHIEKLNVPYELDDMLVGDERDPHVAFGIDLGEEDGTIAVVQGGRFDDFLKDHVGKKDSTGVAASVYFRKKGANRTAFTSSPKEKLPKIYFVQLGLRAKLQGLFVLDMLREARIPVSQSFDSTHLSPQLQAANQQGVTHMLIMGQREALDGTIIVRSTSNSSQTIVTISQLPRFLKQLR